MLTAAKKKMPHCGGITFLWVFLFLAVALCLPKTRLWDFTPVIRNLVQPTSFVSSGAIGENLDAWHNVASGSYYDPNVEFLEVGVKVNNNPTTWKAYGVDKDGTHGGLQGIGGLEAIITPNKTYSVIHDALGHVVATYDGTETKRVVTQVGSYGPLPGSLALPLSAERGLHEVTHWLGKRIDETGFINLGARPYNPQSGNFITADPFGHAGSWDLYSLCNGNPVGYVDPTGRLSKGMFQGAAMGDHFEAENTAQGIGKFIGQVGMGLMPYAGQVATMMGLTGDFGTGLTGASLAMAGGSFLPKPNDAAAKAGVQPLFGNAGSAVTDVAKNATELRFSQHTASPFFSMEGKFAGRSIATVADDLRAGALSPADLPVHYLVRDGNRLIINTRSSLALKHANVPTSQWNLINQTGIGSVEANITQRLLHNRLGVEGTDVLRITGAGKGASVVKP